MANKINVDIKKVAFEVEMVKSGAPGSSGYSGYSGYSGASGECDCPIYTDTSGISPNQLTKVAYKDKDSNEWILSTIID